MAFALASSVVARPSVAVSTRPAARRSAVVVRASSEPEKPVETPSAPAAPAAQPAVVRPHNPTKSAATSAPGFGDIMAFNGAGPELINGRLAMLGFVAALGAEVASGSRVTQQLSGAAGPIALTFALFTAASVIPLLKGNKNTESFGKLTPAVELLNGRAAMIGFAALLIIEAVNGSALF